MAKVNPKIGDVFRVNLDCEMCAYLQYVADDTTQLNSEVVRVFAINYSSLDDISLDEIVSGVVDFYAHTIIRTGVRMGLWERVGNAPAPRDLDVYFNSSEERDLGAGHSTKWWVWRVNEEMKFVGQLANGYEKSEVGDVIPAPWIVERIKTGEYQFVYPT